MVRRLFIYLFGVGLGVIVSFIFFGDREIDFSYLPNARTIKHLRSQTMQFSEEALCQLDCLSMTEVAFENFFKSSDLDIDFSQSDVRSTCKNYHVNVVDQKFSKFNIHDCDSISTVNRIDATDCQCQ